MNGSGTSGDPWQVATYADLKEVGDEITYFLDDYYIQTADIDASDSETENGGEGWIPIGSDGNEFVGEYDGDGHSISNLFIDRASGDQGLFGVIANSTTPTGVVKNLLVLDVDITGGGSRVGALAGYNRYGIIENCGCSGFVVNTTAERTGGIVGQLWNDGTNYGTVSNCYSEVDVTGGTNYTGGAVGRNNGVVEYTYSTGAVTASGSNIGGCMGVVESGATATANYYDTTTSGQSDSTGATGLATASMQDYDTFNGAGWDITDGDPGSTFTWFIDDGNDYPRLFYEYEGGGSVDNLTAVNLTSAAPILNQSTIGQVHALTSQNEVLGIPVIAQSEIGQVHSFTSQNEISGVPINNQAIIGQIHIFVSENEVSGQPVNNQSVISTEGTDNLESVDLVSGTPTEQQSELGQVHIFESYDLTGGIPVLQQSSIVIGVDALTSVNTVSGAPILNQSTIAQIHNIISENLASGIPVYSPSSLGQIHDLISMDLVSGVPVLGISALDQAVAEGYVTLTIQLLKPSSNISLLMSSASVKLKK